MTVPVSPTPETGDPFATVLGNGRGEPVDVTDIITCFLRGIPASNTRARVLAPIPERSFLVSPTGTGLFAVRRKKLDGTTVVSVLNTHPLGRGVADRAGRMYDSANVRSIPKPFRTEVKRIIKNPTDRYALIAAGISSPDEILTLVRNGMSAALRSSLQFLYDQGHASAYEMNRVGTTGVATVSKSNASTLIRQGFIKECGDGKYTLTGEGRSLAKLGRGQDVYFPPSPAS